MSKEKLLIFEEIITNLEGKMSFFFREKVLTFLREKKLLIFKGKIAHFLGKLPIFEVIITNF